MQSPPITERTVAQARAIYRRVFVPVDFSMSSHRALGAALELARTQGSTVCLFNMAESEGEDDFLGGIGSPAVGGDWPAESEERLHRFVENVAPGYVDRVEVRSRIGGDAARSIHEEAARWGATLIVVASEMHARWLRSPAERIVRDLDIPILLIPGAAS